MWFDSHTGVDWIDPQDPTVIAEAELLSAANSIEAAARKLTTLQPKLKPKVYNVTNAAKNIFKHTIYINWFISLVHLSLVDFYLF